MKKQLTFLITILLLIFPKLVIAQEHPCGLPYDCRAVADKRNAKIVRFTSRAAYETWLNAADRANCDAPFYSTASVVEVICYDGTFIKQCRDDYGICIGG